MSRDMKTQTCIACEQQFEAMALNNYCDDCTFRWRQHNATPRPRVPDGFVLYHVYEGETLLYIGQTNRPGGRLRGHMNTKPWWKRVTKITLDHYQTREQLDAAERLAIANEEPLYNVNLRTRTTA